MAMNKAENKVSDFDELEREFMEKLINHLEQDRPYSVYYVKMLTNSDNPIAIPRDFLIKFNTDGYIAIIEVRNVNKPGILYSRKYVINSTLARKILDEMKINCKYKKPWQCLKGVLRKIKVTVVKEDGKITTNKLVSIYNTIASKYKLDVLKEIIGKDYDQCERLLRWERRKGLGEIKACVIGE